MCVSPHVPRQAGTYRGGMQSQLTATRTGNPSSLDSVASAMRWAFPLLVLVIVTASLALVVTSAVVTSANTNNRPAVVVPEAYPDHPNFVP
jgi:hypothetical protein